MASIGSPGLWSAFAAVILLMLLVDVFAIGRDAHRAMSVRTAAAWSAAWAALALLFAGALWWFLDGSAGRGVANETTLAFLTAYLVEKSLAVDNVFVWLTLFGYFAIPPALQKRVLVYGVLGAIVMRAAMIFGGVWLVATFHWLLYVFGAFLLVTGVKMWWLAGQQPDLDRNPLLRWLRRHLNLTPQLHGERLFVRIERAGQLVRCATPLFLALVLVEATDLIFAVDSIPAILAISTDPFIMLTSNVFAILGLRSMYFLFAGAVDRFPLLKYGLALVLAFIGLKMILIDVVAIPIAASLAVVAGILGAALLLSRRRPGTLAGAAPGAGATHP
ncbi:MAG: TerC/Alx family metal homeostasis membrane protein [Steroidobacteraceae bacterium]